MNTLTLKYDGTEQTLDAWGLYPITLTYRSKAAGTFECSAFNADPAVQAVTPLIPYGGLIELWDGRAGSGTEWTGGTRIFVGKRRDLNGIANGDNRDVTLIFKDAWDSLERTTYQMTWTGRTGTTFSPRCYLFQNIGNSTTPWTYWQTKDQINDVIIFAHTQCGIPIQAGTIDPLLYQPIYPCYSPKCSDVILLALTSVPDAVTWFDYTTNDGSGNPLPTLHVRQRQNCSPVNLPYGDGTKHVSTNIKSRDDLQAFEVVFNYQESNTVGGISWYNQGVDAYPIGSTGLGEQCVVEAIDLTGMNKKQATAELNAEAIDPTTVAFWQDKIPSLDDGSISGLALVDATINGGSGHPQGITIEDYTGAALTLATYPNELKSGQVAAWMVDATNTPILCKEAIITAHVKYTKKHPVATGLTTDTVTDHIVTTRVHLTNSGVGAKLYRSQAQGTQGESPCADLAYLFWCSVNNVPINIVGGLVSPPSTAPDITNAYNFQWEGQHIIVEDTISTFYTCFNTLNLTGGASNWAAMNAAIYEIAYDFFNGTTTINFGPNKKLSAKQFFSMMMLFRSRIVVDDGNIRSTGVDQSANGVALGRQTRVQDTTNAAPASKQISTVATTPASGSQTVIQHDAGSNGGTLTIGAFNSPAGTLNTSETYVQAKMSDIADPGMVVMWRKVPMLDASCNKFYAWVLCSEAVEDTDGSADSFFPS